MKRMRYDILLTAIVLTCVAGLSCTNGKNTTVRALLTTFVGPEVTQFTTSMVVENVPVSDKLLALDSTLKAKENIKRITISDFDMDIRQDGERNPRMLSGSLTVYWDGTESGPVSIEINVSREPRPGDRTPEQIDSLMNHLLTYSMPIQTPPETTPVSLADAIRSCPVAPEMAQRIGARYYLHQRSESGERLPLWRLCLVGIKPMQMSHLGHKEPERLRNFVRVTVNGLTGELIGWGS